MSPLQSNALRIKTLITELGYEVLSEDVVDDECVSISVKGHKYLSGFQIAEGGFCANCNKASNEFFNDAIRMIPEKFKSLSIVKPNRRHFATVSFEAMNHFVILLGKTYEDSKLKNHGLNNVNPERLGSKLFTAARTVAGLLDNNDIGYKMEYGIDHELKGFFRANFKTKVVKSITAYKNRFEMHLSDDATDDLFWKACRVKGKVKESCQFDEEERVIKINSFVNGIKITARLFDDLSVLSNGTDEPITYID